MPHPTLKASPLYSRKSAHDVSDEPRDASGKWTAGSASDGKGESARAFLARTAGHKGERPDTPIFNHPVRRAVEDRVREIVAGLAPKDRSKLFLNEGRELQQSYGERHGATNFWVDDNTVLQVAPDNRGARKHPDLLTINDGNRNWYVDGDTPDSKLEYIIRRALGVSIPPELKDKYGKKPTSGKHFASTLLQASPLYSRKSAKFREEDHPRADDGKFGSGGGSRGGEGGGDAKPKLASKLGGTSRPIRRTADTTYEGVPKSEAKTITREQARDAIAWHDGMTLIAGSNQPNKGLPDAARPQLPAEQRGALQKYSYLNDGPLNGMLRGKAGWDKDTPYGPAFYEEMHAQLQSAFAAAEPFDKPVRVVRGMKLSPEAAEAFAGKLRGAMESGQPISFDGYTSTTKPGGLMYTLGMNSGVKAPFRGNVTLKINATHGIDMAPHSQLTGEGELLLPHGAQFQIASVELRKDGYHVTLDQIPPQRQQPATKGLKMAKQTPDEKPADNQNDEAALRKFVEEHPEHLAKWVDTDADFVRFADEPKPDQPPPDA